MINILISLQSSSPVISVPSLGHLSAFSIFLDFCVPVLNSPPNHRGPTTLISELQKSGTTMLWLADLKPQRGKHLLQIPK